MNEAVGSLGFENPTSFLAQLLSDCNTSQIVEVLEKLFQLDDGNARRGRSGFSQKQQIRNFFGLPNDAQEVSKKYRCMKKQEKAEFFGRLFLRLGLTRYQIRGLNSELGWEFSDCQFKYWFQKLKDQIPLEKTDHGWRVNDVEGEVNRMFDDDWEGNKYPLWDEYDRVNNNMNHQEEATIGGVANAEENLKLKMIFSADGGSFDRRNKGVVVKLIRGDEEWWAKGTRTWRAVLNLSLGVFVMKESFKTFQEEISPIYQMIYQVSIFL